MIKIVFSAYLFFQVNSELPFLTGPGASLGIFDVNPNSLECRLVNSASGLIGALTSDIIITDYKNEDVSFYLWTRNNVADSELNDLKYNNSESLADSNFDGRKKTYIIAHGYTHYGAVSYILDIKNNILSVEDANVISIDMRKPLSIATYYHAVCNVYKIAKHVSFFIKWLVESTPLKPGNIHLIGHSLGAHVVGLTGHNVQKIHNLSNIGRITGLDPALVLFYEASDEKSLNKTQADYVDVIHTNSCENLVEGCLGLPDAVGHHDFYPNGGQYQPGCVEVMICSHNRAYEFYAESIKPVPSNNLTFKSWPFPSWDDYKACKCHKCNGFCLEMGYPLNPTVGGGKYFLSTNGKAPYAKGENQC